MEFVDETRIRVRSGDGGDGCVAFRRERNIPLGGPTGGDGGDGGSVRLRASRDIDTLLPLARTRSFVARNGEPGHGAYRHGKTAADVLVEVPVGTVVHDESGAPVADLSRHGQEVLLAHGGRGGRGNAGFKDATNQSPREFTYGGDGLERHLRLELKLIADVGLLGFPNAGKSTLLSRLSAARPRIADYPFTTLQPQLGIVSDGYGKHELVLADIPGIIEGAAEGAGMGLEFLRHVERCRLLLHLVDLCPFDGTYPWDRVRAIDAELERYSPVLASRPRILVGNKLDLPGAAEAMELLEAELGQPVLGLSAVTGMGLDKVRAELFRRLAEIPRPEASPLATVADLDRGGARVGGKAVRSDPRRGGAMHDRLEGEEWFPDDPEDAFDAADDEDENEDRADDRPSPSILSFRDPAPAEADDEADDGDDDVFVPDNPDDVFDTSQPLDDDEDETRDHRDGRDESGAAPASDADGARRRSGPRPRRPFRRRR